LDASIVVCTYNRAASLTETLYALKALKDDSVDGWEVIVVDNNSSDDTRKVVEDLASSWPRLTYAFEPEQGLSHARNHGIRIARGEVILFTDDDVLPEPDWMEKTLEGMRHHGADACGGYVAPIWETEPPEWLTERFHGFLAIRADRTDDYRITDPRQAPFGANMAVMKKVFDDVGLFDTERGRKGKVLASGEDGELFERILAAGHPVWFLGSAKVHHKVEAFRLTKSYIRKWRYQTSRNLALAKGAAGGRRLAGIPLYMYPQLLRAVGRMLKGYLTEEPDEAFYREVIVFHFLGFMQGLRARKNYTV